MRPPLALLLATAAAALLALAAAVLLGGRSPASASAPGPASASASGAPAARPAGPAATGAPAGAGPRAEAGGAQIDPLAPLPAARPTVVTPAAGEVQPARGDRAGDGGATAGPGAGGRNGTARPAPERAASRTPRRGAVEPMVRGLRAGDATALPNGVALPPLEAPEAVMEVIRAGNTIARSPYKWGGGHGRFQDDGYDCSGSVSYALFAAGLIEGPRTSGQLERWGVPGKGRWITVYANDGHTFMEVAGIRFDTSGRDRTGSRWQNERRSTAGFVVRHPPGL